MNATLRRPDPAAILSCVWGNSTCCAVHGLQQGSPWLLSQARPGCYCCCCHTHFLCAFISAMAPDTDFVATAAVLCTLKRPRTRWALALAPGQRHRCPALLLLSAVCILVCWVAGINVRAIIVAGRSRNQTRIAHIFWL